MNVRQYVTAVAMALGAVAAHANTISFSTFTLTGTTDVSLLATSATSAIASFSVLSQTPVLEDDSSTYWSLDFAGLAAGTYTVKLETFTGAPAVSIAAVDGSSTPLALTPVPEPESYAMALAGLSIAGLMLHRRRAVSV